MQKDIEPITPFDGSFQVPPSKACTLRSLFLGALAEGITRIEHGLHAEDQRVCMEALSQFGPEVEYDGEGYTIRGSGGDLTAPEQPVSAGRSGVTGRCLVPFAALADGTTTIRASEQLRKRPMDDLLRALERLGGSIQTPERESFPMTISGPSYNGGCTGVRTEKSSQFLSALLLSAPYTDRDVNLEAEGAFPSRAYVELTIQYMNAFGVEVEQPDERTFKVPSGQQYEGRRLEGEGDFASASYLFAAAAVTGGTVEIRNLNPVSAQPDRTVLDLLDRMGCRVSVEGQPYDKWKKGFKSQEAEENERREHAITPITVEGGSLERISASLRDAPDLLPTMSIVAAFAEGTSVFENVQHLKYKESDRLEALSENLEKCNIHTEYRDGSFVVHGGNPEGAKVNSFDDHRIAMAFSVLGLAKPGVTIQNAEAIQKSYPEFYETIQE